LNVLNGSVVISVLLLQDLDKLTAPDHLHTASAGVKEEIIRIADNLDGSRLLSRLGVKNQHSRRFTATD
jgi:hypothetical protein